MTIRTEHHVFGMGHTIEGAIRLKNPLVEQGPELQKLIEHFNRLNNNECTFMGKSYIIPVDERYQLLGTTNDNT